MAFPVANIYEDEDLQGPGWLLFFTETVRVIPARGGSAGSAGSGLHEEETIFELEEPANYDDDDISDIVTIIALSGIL